MTKANDTQVAGNHYRTKIQHWDYVWANELDYFQAQITKYITRWKKKNGLQDLEKALHFLQKYLELVRDSEKPECNCGYPMGHTPGCSMYQHIEEALIDPAEANERYVNQD